MERDTEYAAHYFPQAFDEFVHEPLHKAVDRDQVAEKCHAPLSNILETEDGFALELAVPGIKRSDVQITFQQGTLYVKCAGTILHDHREFRTREFSRGALARAFVLPPNIKPEGIKAKCEHGLLQITLKKETSVAEAAIAITID